ncbi:granzyme B-like isoform X1 [Syngnathus acus]|uniref:granzyme B-like isoform X1 n=1 Tax=Syngnathus acus TaxID=161584 RepID=UPI001886151F|nr:granzyme B-like isoform X1 [Syngnathus acus]
MSLDSQCSTCTSIAMYAYHAVFVLQLFFCFTEATGSSIVGGKVSEPHSKAYMASLQVNGFHRCGGVLIRKDFVLTAAHCKSEKMTVILGAHNISQREKSQQRIEVAKFHPHPRYNDKNFSNDIMLLKLQHNAQLNKYVKVLELPKKKKKNLPANTICTIAGWGQTVSGSRMGLMSDVLKETTEKTQFNFECKHIWKDYFQTEVMICTKHDQKGGCCWGDSGGPLICKKKLEGIVAYADPQNCSNPRYPHVFTKVHSFLPWIEKVMQGKTTA